MMDTDDILDLLNESPTWNNHSVPEPKEQMNKGMIHVLIGDIATGKTTYAESLGIPEYGYSSGFLGGLAVNLVGFLTRNRHLEEEYLQYAVSMLNEDAEAINLIRSVAEYFGRPVRIVRITEYS